MMNKQRKKPNLSSRDLKASGEDIYSLKLQAVKEGSDQMLEDLKSGEEQDFIARRSQSIFSNRSSVHADAADYYRNYGETEEKNDPSHILNGNIVGECYLNFSKLLQSEMRKLDKRDSSIL